MWGALALVLAAAAWGLYTDIGQKPEAPQAQTNTSEAAEYAALEGLLKQSEGISNNAARGGSKRTSAELRELAQRHPNDGRIWALLAYAEFEADAYAASASAFERAVATSTKVARDPGVLCDWADALGMAQDGKLAGRPRELISQALTLKPEHPKALEMAGSAAFEAREFDLAARYWKQLITLMPENGEQQRAVKDAIQRAERLAATSLPTKR